MIRSISSVDDIGYRFHVDDELENRYSLVIGTGATDPANFQVETRLHWNETPVGSTTKEWTRALRAMQTSNCCPGPLVVSLFQAFPVA